MKKRRLMSLALAAALSFSIAVPAHAADDDGGGDNLVTGNINSAVLETDNDSNKSYSFDQIADGKGIKDILNDIKDIIDKPDDPDFGPPSSFPILPPAINPDKPDDPPVINPIPSDEEDDKSDKEPDDPMPEDPQEEPQDPQDNHRPKHTNYSVDDVNFFINLGGDVLDTTTSSGHYSSALFTSALTSEYDVDGEDLEDAVAESSYYGTINTYYDAIIGDEDEYEDVDDEIRSVLSEFITVPSDADILSSIKTQISDGTKIYDINDELVSESLVSTDYYNVYWYVLKEGNSYWHVDGILEKKSQPTVNTFDVTYSWTVTTDEAGVTLPSSVTVPEKVTYRENDEVTPDSTYTSSSTINDTANDGYWTFSGWSITTPFNITEDTEITGEWVFHKNESVPTPPSTDLYTVSYEWTVEEGGPGLPETVMLPAGESRNTHYLHSVNGDYYEGIEVTVTGGKYVFSGWKGYALDQNVALEPGHHVALDETRPSVVIHGSWDWVEDAPTTYKYVINYYDIHGGTIRDTASGTIEAGASWNLDYLIPFNIDSKAFYSKVGSSSAGMNCQADVVIDVYYKGRFCNTIFYIDIDTDTEIKDMFIEHVECCSNWDYTDKIPNEIVYNNETYSLVDVIGDASGEKIANDNNINVRYRKSTTPPEEVPDTPVVYSVSYEWTVNGGPGLPTTVTLPAGESSNTEFNHLVDAIYYAGYEVNVTGGKYVFSGWQSEWQSDDIVKVRANNNPVVVRGSWNWIKDEPTPTPTPSNPSKKTYYTIKVEFVDSNGNAISDDYTTTVRKNHDYDVTNKIPDIIMVGDQEYILKTTTGDPLSGIANSNKKITAWYELKTIIPPVEDETIIVIPPEETPEPPKQPETKPEEPKDELDKVPKTGDAGIAMNIMGTISSITGILYLSLKKKDEE